MMKLKVLIVDDDVNILRVLGDRLEREGYRVLTARDGREALVVNEREDPDLLLLDLRLPRMGGMEVLQAIKREEPDKPVVIVTSSRAVETEAEAMRLGAFDYITKPFDPRQVLKVVSSALDR